MLRNGGWVHERTTGSHGVFRHPQKPGAVTVPNVGQGYMEVKPGTLRNILRQAGLEGSKHR